MYKTVAASVDQNQINALIIDIKIKIKWNELNKEVKQKIATYVSSKYPIGLKTDRLEPLTLSAIDENQKKQIMTFVNGILNEGNIPDVTFSRIYFKYEPPKAWLPRAMMNHIVVLDLGKETYYSVMGEKLTCLDGTELAVESVSVPGLSTPFPNRIKVSVILIDNTFNSEYYEFTETKKHGIQQRTRMHGT